MGADIRARQLGADFVAKSLMVLPNNDSVLVI
jgi:hypothetical protein